MLYSNIALMNKGLTVVANGSVTSPAGFQAGAVSAGIKTMPGALDLALLISVQTANAAAVFTRNRFRAAPVVLSENNLNRGKTCGIIVNSGCANAGTGSSGYRNAVAMTQQVAEKLSVGKDDILIASTGVIGVQLPMTKIEAGINQIALSWDSGHNFARAIMTTDLAAKEVAVTVPDYGFTVGSCAKGSGMIHPDMATMLAFITTDAGVDGGLLRTALKKVVDKSFNLISVDGDTSTNDSVFLMANGASGCEIKNSTAAYRAFIKALEYVCVYLAKAIVRDGEGATRLFEFEVCGAASTADARKIIRTVLSSPLVKTAVHGADPNWGRIMAAVGRSGVRFDAQLVKLWIGDVEVLKHGAPQSFDTERASAQMQGDDVFIRLDMGLGKAMLTGWGCDMSAEYIRINADYTT